MNDTKPRNRYRLTKVEQAAERDKAQQALNALSTKLLLAYGGIVGALMAGVYIGLSLR